MGESRNMDAAMRIKEINFAREKLAEEPFLEGDAKIKESFEYGLCKQLVINDPEYDSKLSLIKERLRIRKAQASKEERERDKILAEENRNKRLIREEEERKEKERKEQLKRIADTKAIKEKNEKIKQYTNQVIETFKTHPPKPTLKKILYPNWRSFGVRLGCKNFIGLGFRVVAVFKEHGQVVGPETFCANTSLEADNNHFFGLQRMTERNDSNYNFYGDLGPQDGYYIPPKTSSSISDPKKLIEFLKTTKNPKKSIESIYIHLSGSIRIDKYKKNFSKSYDEKRFFGKKMNPATYGLEEYGDSFSVPKEYAKFILYESKN